MGSGRGEGGLMGLGRGQVLGTLKGQSPEPRYGQHTQETLMCVIGIGRKEQRKRAVC